MKNEGGLDEQLRFVLLWHVLPADADQQSHWDLMFEVGSVLWTLQLATLPENRLAGAPQLLTAKRLTDHRLDYLDYEGLVSRNRGSVQRIASGTYAKSPSAESEDYDRFIVESEHLQADLHIANCNPGDSTQVLVHRWDKL